MKVGINKLDEHLDQIVIWLRENTNVKITASIEERASLILKRIAGLEKMSNTEFERLVFRTKENYIPPIKVIQETTECSFCKIQVKTTRINKHLLICPKRKFTKGSDGKKRYESSQSFNTGYYPAPDLPDKKTERRLDGSKDFYQFRNKGKYGSHSSYDNYDDESFA